MHEYDDEFYVYLAQHAISGITVRVDLGRWPVANRNTAQRIANALNAGRQKRSLKLATGTDKCSCAAPSVASVRCVLPVRCHWRMSRHIAYAYCRACSIRSVGVYLPATSWSGCGYGRSLMTAS